MNRVGAMMIAAGVVLSVSLLRPAMAVGQASREVNGGAQALAGEPTAGSGLMNRDRGTHYSALSVAERPEEALLGRSR